MSTSQLPEFSPTRDASVAAGLAARERVPLFAHAHVDTRRDRDPVGLLRGQDETRVQELVPVRHERMLESPFTFYRGSALVMADDLGALPHSGLVTQLCGDAHLSNFGAYGSPERRLVFDLNDFDETLPGPFEWDVKRLAASMVVAARDNGHSDVEARENAVATVRAYQVALAEFAARPMTEVWYARMDAQEQLVLLADATKKKQAKAITKSVKAAHKRTSLHALSRLTELVDGHPRFVPDPPLLVPAENVETLIDIDNLYEWMRMLVRDYTASLTPERRLLIENFSLTHAARKVVGVGSVGMRAWVLLMEAHDGLEPLLLQAKEARASVLAAYLGDSEFDNQGERVVTGQRIMQAASDVLLGWQRTRREDQHVDYYVRQLRDWKYSVETAGFDSVALTNYGRLCAWTLARAHARGGDRIAMAAYLGDGLEFAEAVGDFSLAYADLTVRDHAAFGAAVA
ncbi:DUF2252 domain-containing protein [Demequina sp.]|uniref:DUF2252 domain-containing protein n=1 Tax=Demequina sp. TaxID=2050685 RepID=UPI003D132246